MDYTTVTNFFLVNGSHQVRENLYLGLEVLSWAAQVSLQPDLVSLPDERYTGPGLVLEWDSRDNIMFPTTGRHLGGRFTVYSDATGSDRAFNKLKLSLTGYRSLGNSTRILAGRIMTESAFGDVPFSGQAILSGNKNLRGYANGRNRADRLMMLESEYRWNFWRRWSMAVFAGVAWVADDLAAIRLGPGRPGTLHQYRRGFLNRIRLDVFQFVSQTFQLHSKGLLLILDQALGGFPVVLDTIEQVFLDLVGVAAA